MTNASWNGFGSGNFINSSPIAGGAGGRTFIDGIVTDRILQAGTLLACKYMCGVSSTNAFKFKVFRVNGSNYDFVGESEKFTPVAGNTVQSRTFTSPITGVRVGDVFGLWIDVDPGSGPTLDCTSLFGASIPWIAGDEVGSNVAFPNTVSNFALNVEAFGAQPTAGMTGDSIEVGHGGTFTSYFDGTGPVLGADGTPACELGYNMRALLGASWGYQDFARGSQTFAWVLSTGIPAILTGAGTNCSVACGAAEIWVHCGVNDVFLGRTWGNVLSDLNAIYALVGTTPLFIDEILPDTNFNDTLAGTIRTFNTNLAAWAVGKATVRIVSCWSALGQVRVSTGLFDDLKSSYNSGDGVHINSTGAAALAALRVTARSSYYGGGAHPVAKITQAISFGAMSMRRYGSFAGRMPAAPSTFIPAFFSGGPEDATYSVGSADADYEGVAG